MNGHFANTTAPTTLTSKTASPGAVRIGQALFALEDTIIASSNELLIAAKSTCEKLELFKFETERYANVLKLSQVSSPCALKAWAAESLPGLGISYGFSNRLTREIAEQSLDKEASLQIVKYAEDLTVVAKYCRDISELSIEIIPDSHGIEFRFHIKGTPKNKVLEQAEQDSFQQLLRERSRNNSFKNKIVCTSDRIEAQFILFRKKIRLGFSPVPFP